MRFYNRELELAELEKLWKQADEGGKLAVLTGRRRLGKTLLATEFTKKLPFFYLFVEKKPESLLCEDYISLLQTELSFPVVGEIKRFRDLFLLLLEHSKKNKIVLIIDEFQEFYTINPSVYSEIQNLWDAHKRESKMLLIVVGSVYSLMHKIFEDEKEPLFGRADRTMKLSAFSIPILMELLKEHGISDLQTIFDFYVLTGSVPKYLDLLMTNGVRSRREILSFMLSEFSPFLEEGRNSLIEEFGKDYGTYFAILELLSLGKTARPEIESILGRDVGGYIEKLEITYNLLYRIVPLDEKVASRMVKYAIKDPFLNFWFRFIYRNRSAIELKNFEYVHKIIDRDYATYCGRFLERFFLDLLALKKKYNRLGTYWEAKNINEIDIVGVNDLEKQLFIAEVKINPKKLNLHELQTKAQNLIKNYPDYQVLWAGLSLKDATEYL
jgi:AAA+ ATPase superfamily predicted ATPase